jgi:hypothetical protein
MNALAERRVMALARSEQLLRFFRTRGLHPPLFDTRDQQGRVESPQSRLLLSSKGSGSHIPIRSESILSNHFTLKPALLEQTGNSEAHAPPRGGWNTLLSTSLSQKLVRICRQ